MELDEKRKMAKKQQSNISGIFLALFVTILMFLSLNIFKDNILNEKDTLWKNWVNGQVTEKIETAYNKESPIASMSKNLWTALHYYLFKQTRTQKAIIETQDNHVWLFTAEEYDVPKNSDKAYLDNINYIKAIAAQLEKQAIDLHIILLPSKARLFATKTILPRIRQTLYEETINQLSNGQISITPALQPLLNRKDEKIFFQNDTHWTPLGANIIAKQVALNIAKKTAHFPVTIFTRNKQEHRQHTGDLLRYLPFSDPAHHGFKAEAYDSYQYEAQIDDMDAASLFGETELPIALVGTSYSANSTWQFEAALKYALHIDLMNLAIEGVGPLKAMEHALQSDFIKKTPPNLIIWEIPERYLLYPNGRVPNT